MARIYEVIDQLGLKRVVALIVYWANKELACVDVMLTIFSFLHVLFSSLITRFQILLTALLAIPYPGDLRR